MNCRFCNNWRDQGMVKYGPRHHAHFRCFLENGKSLHKIPAWRLGDFPFRLLKEFGITDTNGEFVDPVLRANFKRAQEAA